jgi:hypothetical protein
MFLLPSILLGVVFALLLGGRPSRVLDVEFRGRWLVPGALAIQAALFSPLAARIPAEFESPAHLGSYALLFLFGALNIRILPLLPLLVGMTMNAVAIYANGGRMPVSEDAWDAAGLQSSSYTNVRLGAEHLGFLGDVFALPARLPLANVFSVGDLLVGFGMIAFIVTVSTSSEGERPLVPSRLLRPLRVGSFRRLLAGKLVSQFGDWLTLAALVGWIYGTTGSTTQVAILMLARLAPPIIGGGLAAAVVDRLPKLKLLVAIELMRGLAVSGALAAVVLELRPLAFAVVAASGVLAATSAATVPALVPSLLGDEELPAANAALGIAQDGAMALGALAAGIALSASGAVLALATDLGTFAFAAALYATIRVERLSEFRAEEGETEENRSGFVEGLRYLLSRRILLVVIGGFGAATVATGLTNATLPRLLDALGLGPGGYGFGLAALACGLAVGQGFVGFARVGPGAGRWIGAGLVMMSVLFVGLAYTAHAPTAILVLGLIGLVDGTTDVLFATTLQREADPRFYGRVFGFASAFMATTMMGAVAAAPILNRIAAPRGVILAAGSMLLAASAITLLGSRGSPDVAQVVEAMVPLELEQPSEDPEGPLAPILSLVPHLPPAPQVEAGPEPAPVRVVLRLRDGERIHIGSFPNRDAALECAREVAAYLGEIGTSEWPVVEGRFLRPDPVVSVDLVEEQIAKWTTASGAADDLDGSVGSP